MKLATYIEQAPKLTLEEFLRMDEDAAVRFDFLTQGDGPDERSLTKEIYHRLYPWYDEEVETGDTLNTYRTPIQHRFFSKPYPQLERAFQLEIIGVIERNTAYNPGHLFEEELLHGSKATTYRVENNYQLGNFWILPKKQDGVNQSRAGKSYFDFVDLFLPVMKAFYAGVLEDTGDLRNAILAQADYFNQFGDWDGFVRKNFLQDFFEPAENSEFTTPKPLGKAPDFETFVKTANEIIQARGRRLFRVLTGADPVPE